MKIFLTSASSDKVYQHERLRELWMLSSQKHSLCQQAEEADLVLLSDISGPNWFEDLRKNENIIDPSKCFVVADGDIPMPLLHGIYTSNNKRLKFQSRFRTGAYNLFPKEVHNPFVAQCTGKSYSSPKFFFYSFVGQDSSPLRLQLFQRKSSRNDVLVANSTSYFNAHSRKEDHLPQQQKYCEIMTASKFALCPKGTSGASIRLFEVMKMGVAPVIISDDWILPRGPKWDEFAVIVKEKDLDQLDEILEQREKDYVDMGKKAHEAYQTFFADEVYFDYVIDQILDIQQHQKIPERLFWSLRNMIVRYWMQQRQWRFFKKKFYDSQSASILY
ncbi:MAG: exostosin family protein [Verrucomicrobia bacterium]|nr:MAG: exostosin family protein [Verrucomicrobiota bacterium]